MIIYWLSVLSADGN